MPGRCAQSAGACAQYAGVHTRCHWHASPQGQFVALHMCGAKMHVSPNSESIVILWASLHTNHTHIEEVRAQKNLGCGPLSIFLENLDQIGDSLATSGVAICASDVRFEH